MVEEVKYLHFESKSNSLITFTVVGDESGSILNHGLQYSTDGGTTWVNWIEGAGVAAPIDVKSTTAGLSLSADHYLKFNIIGETEVTGKVSNLLNGSAASAYCFYKLFEGCKITSAPSFEDLTTTANSCYKHMFKDCDLLAAAPALPAKRAAANCYKGMFEGCTSISTVPNISAVELDDQCCAFMFYGCSKIKLSYDIKTNAINSIKVPANAAAFVSATALYDMFGRTGGTWPGAGKVGTPVANQAYFIITGPEIKKADEHMNLE